MIEIKIIDKPKEQIVLTKTERDIKFEKISDLVDIEKYHIDNFNYNDNYLFEIDNLKINRI